MREINVSVLRVDAQRFLCLLCEKICRVGLYTYAIIPTLFHYFLLFCYPNISVHFFVQFIECGIRLVLLNVAIG